MRRELLRPRAIFLVVEFGLLLWSQGFSPCRSNFCPDHESGGAPYLARFSRDVGYHGPRLAAPSFVAEPGLNNRLLPARQVAHHARVEESGEPGNRSCNHGLVLPTRPRPPEKFV
jgi:hypothetical protein